jgi:hypothetical protein
MYIYIYVSKYLLVHISVEVTLSALKLCDISHVIPKGVEISFSYAYHKIAKFGQMYK